MRSLYNLLERVFDRVNRDGGVCGQVTHSRYETEQYRYSLYMPVTVPSDGFLFSIKELLLNSWRKYAMLLAQVCFSWGHLRQKGM